MAKLVLAVSLIVCLGALAEILGYALTKQKPAVQNPTQVLSTDCKTDSDCSSYLSYNTCEVFCANKNAENQKVINELKKTCDSALRYAPTIDCQCVNNKCERKDKTGNPNCAKEGEMISIMPIPEGEKIVCCPGLTDGLKSDLINNECVPQMDAAICIACPDGKCGKGENKCNCPEDCGEEIDTSGWKTYRDEIYGFEFKYPPNLIVRDIDTLKNDGSDKYQILVQNDIYPTPTFCNDNPQDPKCESEVVNGFSYLKDWKLWDQLIAKRSLLGKRGQISLIMASTEEKNVQVFPKILASFKFVEPIGIANWESYVNEKYGFVLKFPETWKNYFVTEYSSPEDKWDGIKLSGNINSVVFGIPANSKTPVDTFFTISIFTNQQWKELHSALSGFPDYIFLDSDKNFSFVETHRCQDCNKGLLSRRQEINQILSTFKFIEKDQ